MVSNKKGVFISWLGPHLIGGMNELKQLTFLASCLPVSKDCSHTVSYGVQTSFPHDTSNLHISSNLLLSLEFLAIA